MNTGSENDAEDDARPSTSGDVMCLEKERKKEGEKEKDK
jgi:hypothetical protein